MSKKLIYALILIPALTIASNGQEKGFLGSAAGFDASIVFPEGDLHPTPGLGGVLDFGFGLGAAGQLHVHPNMEFWLSGHDYYHDNHHYEFETAINADARYYPPVPRRSPVKPFGGMGVAPLITYYHKDYWDPYRNDESWTDINFGFNFTGGIDFKMGSNSIGYAEMRGKIGGTNLIKFTFGMEFLIH